MGPSALFAQNRARLVALARASHLSTVAGAPELSNVGGLLAYGPSYPDLISIARYRSIAGKGGQPLA
jgi:hypothetical protein